MIGAVISGTLLASQVLTAYAATKKRRSAEVDDDA